MKGQQKGRLALVLALALVMALVLPAAAIAISKPTAAKVRPQLVVPPDAYESDNSTTTAKVLPEVSYHTYSSSETTADEDWAKITAEATGTPFVLETQSVAGWFDSDLDIFTVDASGNLVPMPDPGGYSSDDLHNDDSELWYNSYGSTLYFSAPAPGTYFVRSRPHGAGKNDLAFYKWTISKGIARRISGSNRFETAAAVSRTIWPETDNPWYGTDESPNGVIIANGWNFPDALAGSAFSAMGGTSADNMPILLVNQDSVPPATAAEFVRLVQSDNWETTKMKIFVLGSTNAVSNDVVSELMALSGMPFRGADVVRLGGTTRFDTAAKIADQVVTDYGTPSTVFITTAFNFPDGLAVAPLAGEEEGPVLFSNLTTIGPATSQWILDHKAGGLTDAVIVGGSNVINDAVASALATAPYSLDVTRVAGGNRFETARKVAQFGVDNYGLEPAMLLVNGYSFPDALCAGTLTGNTEGVVLLTPTTTLSPSVTTFYDANKAGILPIVDDAPSGIPSYVIGGAPAVSDSVYSAFKNLWKRP